MAAPQRDARGRFIPRPEPELMIAPGTRETIASLDRRASTPNDRPLWVLVAGALGGAVLAIGLGCAIGEFLIIIGWV